MISKSPKTATLFLDDGLLYTKDITLGIDEQFTKAELDNLASAVYIHGEEREGYRKNYEFVSFDVAPIGHRRAP